MKEKPHDPEQLAILLRLLDGAPDKRTVSQAYLSIRKLTGWSIETLRARTGNKFCTMTLGRYLRMAEAELQSTLPPPEPQAEPAPPVIQILPMAEKVMVLPDIAPNKISVFDHIYDATAACARIQQFSSMEVAASLADEMDRRRFILAIKHLIEQAEILHSLADHCGRTAEVKGSVEAAFKESPKPSSAQGY